jgi:hypothetical protein
MFDWIRQKVLRFLRVPRDPEPPFGALGSVRIFRAGKNYYNLRLARWGLGQFGAVIGIIFSLAFLGWFKGDVEAARHARELAPVAAPTQPPAAVPAAPSVVPPRGPTERPSSPARKANRSRRDPRQEIRQLAARTPGWVIPVIEVFEVWGILLFLVQLPVTFAAVRLEFELHWYIVTDRSLRIRTGLLRLQESTMSFANLQQVEVQQGPLQRLLGLADVHVQSAGGGGDHQPDKSGDSLHTGVFYSVNNANEIRDLILERLRQFRQAGLGDPDDHHLPAAVEAATGDALTAANEVLAEVRALRQLLV